MWRNILWKIAGDAPPPGATKDVALYKFSFAKFHKAAEFTI